MTDTNSDLGQAYQPLDPAFFADIYSFYARARRETPLVYSQTFDLWLMSRHRDVLAALKDPARFSSRDTLRPPGEMPAEVQAILDEAGYISRYPLLGDDPPVHAVMRSVAARAFAPARIASLEPRIRAIAGALVDELPSGSGQADLAEMFTFPLPLRVILALLGLPAGDMGRIKYWCSRETRFFTGQLELEEYIAVARDVAEFREYLRELVVDRRDRPRDDFMTTLVQTGLASEPALSVEELMAVASVFVFAGHETTSNLLGNALLHFARQPDSWQALRAERALMGNAVEEALRFDTPVQGMIRTTTEALEVSGVRLPADARVMLLFASANRDEAVFADPDRFDIRRANADRHLGLGHGIHYCIGASLARLEARVALEVLSERLPAFELVEEPTYLPNLVHRGPQRLLVRWG